MEKSRKKRKLESVSLKFDLPQCINFYRRVVCPEQWALILSHASPGLEVKVGRNQTLYFQISELENGQQLEIDIITEGKILKKDSKGQQTVKYRTSRYGIRARKDLIASIQIDGEDYWDAENHRLIKAINGKKYRPKIG